MQAYWNARYSSARSFETDRPETTSVGYDAGDGGAICAEYMNGVGTDVGSCDDPVVNGDKVLFAYASAGDAAAGADRARDREAGRDRDAQGHRRAARRSPVAGATRRRPGRRR